MSLNVYVQDVLRMGDQTALVLTAFSRCQLKHTIALWQLLSAHRSEQLLRLRKVSAAPPPLAWGPPCLLPASCCLCSGLF